MSFKAEMEVSESGSLVFKEVNIDIEKLTDINKELNEKYTGECQGLELCSLIVRLMVPETFDDAYKKIRSMSLASRKERIDKLRFEMDQEIRKLTVLIEDESFDYYLSMQKVKGNEKRISKLLDFDRDIALYADKIIDTIRIGEIKTIAYEKVLTKTKEN